MSSLYVCTSILSASTPQYLCSLPPPQSSPAVLEFCRLCRRSCRSNADRTQQGRSLSQTPQTWPGMEHRSALGTTEMLNPPSHWSADSLPTKIYREKWRGEKMKEERRKREGEKPGGHNTIGVHIFSFHKYLLSRLHLHCKKVMCLGFQIKSQLHSEQKHNLYTKSLLVICFKRNPLNLM